MRARIAVGLGAVVLTGAAIWVAGATARDLREARDLHGVEHVRSGVCRRCHEDHWQSWRRTFHRTMTQDATPEAVLGDFRNARLQYFGSAATMERRGDAFFVRARGERERVVRTVGSRRYQQYLVERGGVLVRLPVAWHVEERRWIHMNGAFLTPDPDPDRPLAAHDWARHEVRWNDNCVFCHNVAPDPGMDGSGRSFTTHVAELGVACEGCHGPGDAHVRANTSPVRRYALHLGDARDPTIVNPARLSPARSSEICGRCHGQRITDDVGRFLRHGDPFVPGDDLALYSAPLWHDTELDGDDRVFAPRFWGDGTPRLTAYEYQGYLQSACTQGGELGCTSCHGMHEGDPRGQLRPSAEGDGACLGCHQLDAAEHSRHEAGTAGSRCVSCHMPRIVYGLIDVHRSHRIETPEPARDGAAGRPDACTSCHVDRSRAWAVRERARLWGDEAPAPAATPIDPMPEAVRAVLGGDPIERAVAARALGDASTGVPEERLGLLLDVMEHDPYPAVRWIAWRAARTLGRDARAPWSAYEATAVPRLRRERVAAIERALFARGVGVRRPDGTVAAELRSRAAQVAIEIGE